MLTIELQRDDAWLRYGAMLPEPLAHDREGLLVWSGTLPGGCKVACGPDAALRLQADLPASWECAERTAAIEAGFAAAAARLGLDATPMQPAAVLPIAAPPDLAARCAESGWPYVERPEGAFVTDLGVPDAYLPALIEARADGIALGAELAVVPAAGERRAALVALLLRVNGAFRLARAVLRGPEPRALLEVVLPRTSGAAELGEALAALAVAARGCAREAQLVAADETIARVFLARSGMLPPL